MDAGRMRGTVGAMLALLLAPVDAFCQQDPTQIATRRALIEQAERARDAGQHAEALDLAERAAQVEGTASLRLFIAQEQSALGRPAEALGNADACARLAGEGPVSSHRDEVRSTCEALIAMLRDRVGTLIVRVTLPAPAGLAITIDGRPLAPTFWNVPYVVSPGTVRIEAISQASPTPIVREVVVVARGQAVATVDGDVAPVVRVPVRAVLLPAPALRVVRVASRPTRAHTGPWALGLAGGAALIGAGISLAGWGLNVGQCTDEVCPDDATRTRVYAFGAGVWSGLGLGALLLGGAIAWSVLPTSPPRMALDLVPTRDGGAVSVRGVF